MLFLEIINEKNSYSEDHLKKILSQKTFLDIIQIEENNNSYCLDRIKASASTVEQNNFEKFQFQKMQLIKSVKNMKYNPDSLRKLNSWILSEGNRINLKEKDSTVQFSIKKFLRNYKAGHQRI